MDESQIMRIPPHNIEAEQSVIGAIIMDHEALIVATETLKPKDFYRPDHQEIYSAIMELYTSNSPVDLVTIQNRLSEKGVLEQVGGISYLAELATIVPTSAHIKEYAKIVQEKSMLRKLIKASQDISAKSYEGEEGLHDIMGFAEKQIFDITQNVQTEDFSHINEIVVTSIDKIEQAHITKGGITGVPTGFIDLDYKTEALVDAQKVRTGNLEPEDWDRIAMAIPNLSAADVFIDDTPGISVMEMRAKCRRLKLEKGLDLIMIDYLQLMTGSSKSDSRQQEISEISRSLKALAREMQAPVIALSQLSRACEARADHRPMLSDLRESGAIEQDADVVMFLYRDEYYHPDSDKKNIGEVIIAKQRNGPTGTVELVWLGQYTKFVNKDRE